MSLKILSKKKNELFSREEITGQMEVKGSTPSRKEALDALCSATGASKDNVVIDEIIQKYGAKTVQVRARIYDSAEHLKKYELDYKTKRINEPSAKPATQ